MADEPLRFTSNVGHQPTFFVPDTGSAGGTAVLTTPKGKQMEVSSPPVLAGRLADGEPNPESTLGPRVGFTVPERFAYEGEYTLTIDQDGEVTTYIIDVEPRRYWVTERFTNKKSLRAVPADQVIDSDVPEVLV